MMMENNNVKISADLFERMVNNLLLQVEKEKPLESVEINNEPREKRPYRSGYMRQRSRGSWQLFLCLGKDPNKNKYKYFTTTIHGTHEEAEQKLQELSEKVEVNKEEVRQRLSDSKIEGVDNLLDLLNHKDGIIEELNSKLNDTRDTVVRLAAEKSQILQGGYARR